MKSGYFKDKEFIITNMKPPRHLLNYLWNDTMICQCDHFGNGYSFRNIDFYRRDLESGERNIYIRDRKTNNFYSANRNYFDLPFDKHECHVGLGYHTVISEYNGIRTEFNILVAVDKPVLLFKIKVKNITKENKDFDLYFVNQPRPDISWHAAYGRADFNKEINGIIYQHNGFQLPSEYTKLFVACDKEFSSFETNLTRFKGSYNGFDNPIALKEEKLSSLGSTFDNYVAAFQFILSLKPNEEFEFVLSSACAKSKEECVELAKEYTSINRFNLEIEKQKTINNSYIDVFNLKSPDEYLNEQVNIWLKRQVSLGKTWGRIYGKGFRDVMQDITAFVSFDPELAKKKILHALKFQYEDGNPIRMFEPNYHYPYNDGGVWVPATILAYINESGDLDILNTELPYLKGDSYENSNLSDSYSSEEYNAGKRKDSVLKHVQSAIDYLLNCRGKHNLVLWRGGDWNDSLNNAGNRGIGESVWLSIATVKAINDYIEILKLLNENEEISKYEKAREVLKAAIEKHGKHGDYYIYGINDDQEIIGGEERVFLNPQSWAVLGNVSNKEELNKAMDEVEEYLKCDFGYVLCSPSFTEGKDNIGRVSYFQPGLVENGAVYNHGVAFKIIADCMLNRNDNAYKTLKLISCDNPALENSGVEPYAVTNMYIGPDNKYFASFAPMAWITGTAGWLYRAASEYICGVRATFNGLKIEPHLPSKWNEIEVERLFRGVKYHIKIARSNNKGIWVNKEKIKGDTIPLQSSKEVMCEVYI